MDRNTNRNIMLIPKFLRTFFEDNGANILIPAGVNESRTMCENNPKNKLITISMYETSNVGKINRLMKNNGRKTIRIFLFKNRKLKRAIRIAITI